MKKIFFLSFICIVAFLSGCSRSESRIATRVDLAALGPSNSDVFSQGGCIQSRCQPTQQIENTETVQEQDTQASASVRISVVTQESQNTYPTQDGSEALFYQQLQESTISMPSNLSVAHSVNLALQENHTAAQQRSQELLSMAQANYESMQIERTKNVSSENNALFYSYSYYTMDTVLRLDTSVFSMTTYYSSYTGGAHPNNTQQAINFDMGSGIQLSLADVLLPEGERGLESKILDWLQAKADDFGFNEPQEYTSIVHEKFGADILNEQTDSWYFSEGGLVAFFNPYEIAPYAAGIIKVEFPYSILKDFLEPRFFPVYRNDHTNGSISTELSREIDTSAYETVEEIGTGSSGPSLSISGAPQVYDLSVSWVSWVGGQPMTQSTVYVTNCLTDEDLILVNLESQADLENLCIRFNPGDGTLATAYLEPATGEATVSNNFGK